MVRATHSSLTFVKSKAIKLGPDDLKGLVETGRKAEAYDIAARLMRDIDVLKKDINEAQMAPISAKSTRTLEYYKAVQNTYLEILEMILKRHKP